MPHLEVCQGDTKVKVVRFAQKQIPKAQPFCLFFQFLDNGYNCLPALFWVSRKLGLCQSSGRPHFLLMIILRYIKCVPLTSDVPPKNQLALPTSPCRKGRICLQ